MAREYVAPDPTPDEYLPLTPALFHVLLALADGEKHGYAILKEVAERTYTGVVLSTGTLYGIIKRLLADGIPVRTSWCTHSQADRRLKQRLPVQVLVKHYTQHTERPHPVNQPG